MIEKTRSFIETHRWHLDRSNIIKCRKYGALETDRSTGRCRMNHDHPPLSPPPFYVSVRPPGFETGARTIVRARMQTENSSNLQTRRQPTTSEARTLQHELPALPDLLPDSTVRYAAVVSRAGKICRFELGIPSAGGSRNELAISQHISHITHNTERCTEKNEVNFHIICRYPGARRRPLHRLGGVDRSARVRC